MYCQAAAKSASLSHLCRLRYVRKRPKTGKSAEKVFFVLLNTLIKWYMMAAKWTASVPRIAWLRHFPISSNYRKSEAGKISPIPASHSDISDALKREAWLARVFPFCGIPFLWQP